MRNTLIIAIVAIATVSSAKNASAWTLLGAESLDLKNRALHLQIGHPELAATLHIPISNRFEIAPKVNLYFAPSFLGGGLNPGHFGNRFGADLKYLFLKKGRLYLAFHVEPALFINYNPLFGGIQLGIPGGVKLNYELRNRMNISASLAVPVSIALSEPTLFANPINFTGGIEIPLDKTMNLSFLAEIGPVIQAVEGEGSRTGLNLRILVGIGMLL
jgi:hypothetical protein